MSHRFELGDLAVYERAGDRVYGTVVSYNDPETVVLEVDKAYDGELGDLLIADESYFRPADDPAPRENDVWR